MTPDDLRAILQYLRHRVDLAPESTPTAPVIAFIAPTCDEMLAAGLHDAGSRRILAVPWWDEMVADIVETPEMCEAGETPEQVLGYARDVVTEYIYKRFPLEES